MTARAADRTLQRYIESARPTSSATVKTYTTSRDATILDAGRLAEIVRAAAGDVDLIQRAREAGLVGGER